MRTLPRFFAVLLLAVTPVLSQTATQTQLQQTLAKIVFASQVTTIFRLTHQSMPITHPETAMQLQQALSSNGLVFSVDNFSSGQTASIANQKVTDYATWPVNNQALQIANNTIHVTNENGTVGDASRADPHWINVGAGPSITGVTVGAAFSPSQFPPCSTYINPTLTVSFQGQTVQWKALYFTNCTDGKMYAVDPVMGNAIPDFWPADVDVYPYELTEVGIAGRLQPVLDWLTANSSATCAAATKLCYENGKWVVPKAKLPTLYVPQSLKQQQGRQYNSTDGLGCADYGYAREEPLTGWPEYYSFEDHWGNGNHHEQDGTLASCQYYGLTSQGDQGPCTSEASEQGEGLANENVGTPITDSAWWHNPSIANTYDDHVMPPHSTSSATGTSATQFDFCILAGVFCSGQVSIAGVTVNFTSGGHMKNFFTGSHSCPPQTGGPGGSPLVVDTQNRGGYLLTRP